MSESSVAPAHTGVASDEAFKIETHGIDYVPPGHRHGRPFELFWLWLGAQVNISAASWLTMSDVPDDFEAPEALSASINPAGGDQGAAVLMPGGSSIVAPDGEIIAGPVYNKETILYGEIDLSRIPREYQAMDTAGHYNRPDIFDVRVDRSPRRPITWTGGATAAGPAGAEG